MISTNFVRRPQRCRRTLDVQTAIRAHRGLDLRTLAGSVVLDIVLTDGRLSRTLLTAEEARQLGTALYDAANGREEKSP